MELGECSVGFTRAGVLQPKRVACESVIGISVENLFQRRHGANDSEQRRIAAWTSDATGSAIVPTAAIPVHELLRQRVGQWPDAVAIECEQEALSFAQLDARSEALARRLAAAGVRRGDVVGLHLPPCVDAVVAVWAAWKAGAAFLPLDPELVAGSTGIHARRRGSCGRDLA